jgi:hypothetical protein
MTNDCPAWLAGSVYALRLRRILFAFARTAAMASLLFAHAEATAAESFGQLFFSTEERHVLDELRDAGEDPAPAPTQSGTKAPEAPMVGVISFDGKVERNGGGSTVWVNGRPVYTGSATVEGIGISARSGTSGETQFVLPRSDADAKPTEFSLKVGQKVAVQNGQKFDAYERRPGEDAETVFGQEPPADGEAPADGATSPAGKGASAAPTPPKGS